MIGRFWLCLRIDLRPLQGTAPQPGVEQDAARPWVSLAPHARDLGPARPRTSGSDDVSAAVRSRCPRTCPGGLPTPHRRRGLSPFRDGHHEAGAIARERRTHRLPTWSWWPFTPQSSNATSTHQAATLGLPTCDGPRVGVVRSRASWRRWRQLTFRALHDEQRGASRAEGYPHVGHLRIAQLADQLALPSCVRAVKAGRAQIGSRSAS
jgi:hypothetical protein